MTRFALAFALTFAACAPDEAPSPEPQPTASDLVCLESCDGTDQQAFCEELRARRYNEDGSLTEEGRRLLVTCSIEFEAQSECLLEHAVCEGGSYSATACAGPCKAECDAMTFCG